MKQSGNVLLAINRLLDFAQIFLTREIELSSDQRKPSSYLLKVLLASPEITRKEISYTRYEAAINYSERKYIS